MKIKFVLGILITMLLMLGSRMISPATAQTPSDDERLKLLSSGAQEIVLELTVPDFQIETVDHQGQTYQRFVIPKAAQTSNPGDPQVPVRGTFLGVPSIEGVSVEVVGADYETLSGYRLYPAPAVRLVGDDIVEPSDIERVEEVFTLNQDRYAAKDERSQANQAVAERINGIHLDCAHLQLATSLELWPQAETAGFDPQYVGGQPVTDLVE